MMEISKCMSNHILLWMEMSLYKGFFGEQWVGLDVILLNNNGVLVADGICKCFGPYECTDTKCDACFPCHFRKLAPYISFSSKLVVHIFLNLCRIT